MHRGGVVLGRTMQLTQERQQREQRLRGSGDGRSRTPPAPQPSSSSPAPHEDDDTREVVSLLDLTSEQDRQLLLTLEALRHAIKRDHTLDYTSNNNNSSHRQDDTGKHHHHHHHVTSAASLQARVEAFYRSLCTHCSSEEERRLVVYRFLRSNHFVIARTVEACRKTAAFRRKQNLDRMALFPSLLPLRGYDAQELCTALHLPYIANTHLSSLATLVAAGEATITTTAAAMPPAGLVASESAARCDATAPREPPLATCATNTAATTTTSKNDSGATADALLAHAGSLVAADAFYGTDYTALYRAHDDTTAKTTTTTTTTTTHTAADAAVDVTAAAITSTQHNNSSSRDRSDTATATAAAREGSDATRGAVTRTASTSSTLPWQRWLQRAASFFATGDGDAAAEHGHNRTGGSNSRRPVDTAAVTAAAREDGTPSTRRRAHHHDPQAPAAAAAAHERDSDRHDDNDDDNDSSVQATRQRTSPQCTRSASGVGTTRSSVTGGDDDDDGDGSSSSSSRMQYSEATSSERLVVRLESSAADVVPPAPAAAVPATHKPPSSLSLSSSLLACGATHNNDTTAAAATTTNAATMPSHADAYATAPCALNFHALLQPIVSTMLHYVPMCVHYWDKHDRPVLYCRLSALRSRPLMQRLFELTPVGSEPVALAVLFQAYTLEVMQQLIRWQTHKHARLRRIADALSPTRTSTTSSDAHERSQAQQQHDDTNAAAEAARPPPLAASRRGVASCIVVLDAADLHYHRVFYRPLLRLVRSVVSFAQQHYPEQMHHVYVINCNKVARVAYVLIRGVLSSATRRKITFCDRATTPRTLLDVIDAELLPSEYGGRCTCRDDSSGGVGGGCVPRRGGSASAYSGDSGSNHGGSACSGGRYSHRASTLSARACNNDDTVSMTSAGDYSVSVGRGNDDLTSESLRLARAYGSVGSAAAAAAPAAARAGHDAWLSRAGSSGSHVYNDDQQQHDRSNSCSSASASSASAAVSSSTHGGGAMCLSAAMAPMLERYVRKSAIAPRKSEVMAFSMRAGEEIIWEFAVKQQRKVVFSAVFVPASGEGGVVTLVTKQRVYEDANHFVSPAPGTVILKWSNKILLGHRAHVHIKVYHDGELDDMSS